METKVLIGPVISEKSYQLANELNKYTFFVKRKTSKIEIAKTIEKEYGVRVLSVRTIVKPGKSKTDWKYGKIHRASDRKKAVVTLKEGDKIKSFFE